MLFDDGILRFKDTDAADRVFAEAGNGRTALSLTTSRRAYRKTFQASAVESLILGAMDDNDQFIDRTDIESKLIDGQAVGVIIGGIRRLSRINIYAADRSSSSSTCR